jgi:hypothetical protein
MVTTPDVDGRWGLEVRMAAGRDSLGRHGGPMLIGVSHAFRRSFERKEQRAFRYA